MSRRARGGHLALALALAVAAAALAGCGGSSGPSLSMKQYQKRSNLLCNDSSIEQFELAGRYLKKHPGTEEAELVVPVGIPPLEKELEGLRELGLPEGGEAKIEAFLAAFEAGIEGLRKDPESALSEQDNPFKEANRLGAKYKLGDCAGNP